MKPPLEFALDIEFDVLLISLKFSCLFPTLLWVKLNGANTRITLEFTKDIEFP